MSENGIEWRSLIGEATVRDYAAGQTSWREIRHVGDMDDFQIMLAALADLELKLPRAASRSWGTQWLSEALAEQRSTA